MPTFSLLRTLPPTGIVARVGPCLAMLVAASLRVGAQAPADSEPLVSVTANGTRAAEVFRGMPLTLTAVFAHPEPFTSGEPPILLAAVNLPWSNAVTLAVVGADGIARTWPWLSAGETDATLTLQESEHGELAWWLAPAQTLALAPGVYTVLLTLNTTGAMDPRAWKGVVEAVPAEIAIRDEPAVLSEEQTIEKFVQLALFSGRQEKPAEALNFVDQLLLRYPASVAGLGLKASILKSMGRINEALATSHEALVQVDALFPDAQEPPGFLLGLNADLREQLREVAPSLLIDVTDRRCTFSWTGVPGAAYILQRSLDLQSWSEAAAVFEVTGSTFRWSTDITDTPQFFRLGY